MAPHLERPAKRMKLLSEDEAEDSSSDASGGVPLPQIGDDAKLKINKDYARRFEHNARRTERHQLEEKYGKETPAGEDDDSSTSEEEDDNGILAAGALDDEFNATLRAIRSKDPRVYDAQATFYTVPEDGEATDTTHAKKEKPVYLQDYHRANLLRGHVAPEDDDPEPTYAQQQEQLKNSVVKAMHEAAAKAESDDEEDGDDFLVAKRKILPPPEERTEASITATEVENAEADPESFLSKFMDSRAWVQAPEVAPHPFESEDEEELERNEAIEEAYNFRFEDPEKSNEVLVSHGRDIAAKYSARTDAPSKRQRARLAEGEAKLTEKQERKLEKARLRKLRIDEAQDKLERIKDAAGTRASELKVDDWKELLTGDFDEDQWEDEMQKKFDKTYYAELSGSDSDGASSSKKKVKKPKWNDELDITDLVPDFDGGEEAQFSLSSDHSEAEAEPDVTKVKSKRKQKQEAQVEKRRQRQQIEQLVDATLDEDLALNGTASSAPRGFHYRETSPKAWGMTSRDILLADDRQLNQFAGLKKLAAFRDPDKKRRDKQRLGKKARLREWRKETFGSERGPRQSLQDFVRAQMAAKSNGASAAEPETSKGKKRRRKRSTTAVDT